MGSRVMAGGAGGPVGRRTAARWGGLTSKRAFRSSIRFITFGFGGPQQNGSRPPKKVANSASTTPCSFASSIAGLPPQSYAAATDPMSVRVGQEGGEGVDAQA